MSVYQTAGIGFPIVGDGVSVDQLVDISKWIDTPISAGSPFQSYPVGAVVIIDQPSFTVTTGLPNSPVTTTITGVAEVNGRVIRITWNSPPPVANSSTVLGNAGFVVGF